MKSSSSPSRVFVELAPAPLPAFSPVLEAREECRRFYDKIACAYDLLSEPDESLIRDAAVELLSPQAGEHGLELGCGTGHCLEEIARAVGVEGRVHGVDISEQMLLLTRARLHACGLHDRATLHHGDILQLPFRTATMDAVLMTFTLELFPDDEAARVLAECHRVLVPGGRLVVAALSSLAPPEPAIDVTERTYRQVPNLMDCRPMHVRATLQRAGFQIEQSRYEPLWAPVEIVRAAKSA